MGPCAKMRVTCLLFCPNGETHFGSNDCANPQSTCPREPGEGYEKCSTICQQEGHAEQVALRAAGSAAVGAIAMIHGHDHACRDCQHALYGAGVAAISFPGWARV